MVKWNNIVADCKGKFTPPVKDLDMGFEDFDEYYKDMREGLAKNEVNVLKSLDTKTKKMRSDDIERTDYEQYLFQ